jgi:hypothetical protein
MSSGDAEWLGRASERDTWQDRSGFDSRSLAEMTPDNKIAPRRNAAVRH